MQLTIPTTLAAVLPLIATMLSGYLSSDQLKPGINALIALAALIVTALACFFLAGNWTGNWTASILSILGYIALLMSGDLSVLRQWLTTSAPLPLYHRPTPTPTPASAQTILKRRASAGQGDEQ
jgi:hypothetical protein